MATRLEMLPSELLIQTMDYLSPPEIFTSFLDLNLRFQQLILPRIDQVDLTHASLTEFRLFCHQLFPRFAHRIQALKLSDDYGFVQTDRFMTFCPDFTLYLSSLQRLTLVKCTNIFQSHFLRNVLSIETLRHLELIDVLDRTECLNAILSNLSPTHQLEKLVLIHRDTTNMTDSYFNYSHTFSQRHTALQYLNVDVQVCFKSIELKSDEISTFRHSKKLSIF